MRGIEEVAAAHGGSGLLQGVYSLTDENQVGVTAYLTPPGVRPLNTGTVTRLWRDQVGEIVGLESLRYESDRGGPGGGGALTIELSHRDNVFTIEFAGLHYSAPGKNSYLYRMAGFSDAWIEVGADRRFATFTGLTAGKYIFSVRGANRDGVWAADVASLKIVVTPPYWATWWFRLLVALVVGGIAVAVYRSRLRGVRMKTELQAAHDAQMAIMPQSSPEVAGFDISISIGSRIIVGVNNTPHRRAADFSVSTSPSVSISSVSPWRLIWMG